jgi:hypothetical protein
MRFSLRHRIAAAVTVPVVAAIALIAGSADAAPAHHVPACLSHQVKYVSHVTPHDTGLPGPSNGNYSTYFSELYDDSGRQVATDDGVSTLYWGDQTWKSFTTGTYYFTDGNIGYAGSFSVATVEAGAQNQISATGITGAYTGKRGFVKFAVTDFSDKYNPVYAMTISVCG